MKHKYSSIMASSLAKVVSVAAIATMTVNIIIPDHKQSETENRPLQTFPLIGIQNTYYQDNTQKTLNNMVL